MGPSCSFTGALKSKPHSFLIVLSKIDLQYRPLSDELLGASFSLLSDISYTKEGHEMYSCAL